MENDIKSLIEKMETEHNRLIDMSVEAFTISDEMEKICPNNKQMEDVLDQIVTARDELKEAINILKSTLSDIKKVDTLCNQLNMN